ncbi:MAG: hypothetical protein QW429_06725 [Thermoprotei archaeon]
MDGAWLSNQENVEGRVVVDEASSTIGGDLQRRDVGAEPAAHNTVVGGSVKDPISVHPTPTNIEISVVRREMPVVGGWPPPSDALIIPEKVGFELEVPVLRALPSGGVEEDNDGGLAWGLARLNIELVAERGLPLPEVGVGVVDSNVDSTPIEVVRPRVEPPPPRSVCCLPAQPNTGGVSQGRGGVWAPDLLTYLRAYPRSELDPVAIILDGCSGAVNFIKKALSYAGRVFKEGGLRAVEDDGNMNFNVDGSIVHVELNNSNLGRLKHKIGEHYSRGFGYLLIEGERKLWSSLVKGKISWGNDGPKISERFVGDEQIPLPVFENSQEKTEMLRRYACAFWGCFFGLDQNKTVDEISADMKDIYEDALGKIRAATWFRQVKSGGESIEHQEIKAWVCKIYENQASIILPENSSQDMRFDVYMVLGGKRVAVEVETLYGVGYDFVDKIKKDVDTRLGSGLVDELWVVLPPQQAVLFGLSKDLRNYLANVDNRFKLFTLSVGKNGVVELKSLEDVERFLFCGDGGGDNNDDGVSLSELCGGVVG